MACILITDRTALNGATEIDWDRNKRPQGVHNAIKNGNNIFRGDEISVVVSHAWHEDADGKSGHSLVRCHQSGTDDRGRTLADWGGNFSPWTSLLWTDSVTPHDGPIRILFNSPFNSSTVRGVGAQIQLQPGFRPDGFFTGKIAAFGSLGEKIAEFPVKNCPSTTNGDNTAQFIGLIGQGISRVEFYAGDLDSGEFYPEGFAINRLSVLV